MDFSGTMIKYASERHPEYRFIQADAHEFWVGETFDVVILSDLVNDVWDVQIVFEQLAKMVAPHTRVMMNTYSRLWQGPLTLAQKLSMSRPNLEQNWLTVEDISNLLDLTGFELIKHTKEIISPVKIPVLTKLANQYAVKLWPFSTLALANFLVARPAPSPSKLARPRGHRVSVIVPARNEAGNIEGILARTPEMGSSTEFIFVEGHSKDDTYEAIQRAIARYPERQCTIMKQTEKGKGNAVRLGFAEATGDILMILDADMTVRPECLPRFYQALISGKGEFINGIRLVYPMEGQAMRFFNLIGNKFFSLAFSWLLGQPIKDTLCGTKVLWKRDYEHIAARRSYFGDFDPFGDFDLLFGAAKLGLKIVDLPIRYHKRTYGTTNINRWTGGWLLLRMVVFAARRIKFI